MTTTTIKPASLGWMKQNSAKMAFTARYFEYACDILRDENGPQEIQAHVCGSLQLLEALREEGIDCDAFVQCNQRGEHGNGVLIRTRAKIEYEAMRSTPGPDVDQDPHY